MLNRKADITPIGESQIQIYIDDEPVNVVEGETVLSAIHAVQKNQIMQNDYKANLGAYCGMGICHSCLVNIDGKYKQRSCKTLIRDGMRVTTMSNRFNDMGIKDNQPLVTSADFEEKVASSDQPESEDSNVN
ncbi:(2Fe-2S)-binding protein [Alteromonas sp. a30]|uniref:(2Fe-2S)-binding protein n=1 Tax=Alteromonas sp. a30 TaxID=2730917 RepID=UPI00227ED34B|nr:(2Fe-2S)-binding protein [Alteromonas sp. a30]MCY7295679.1 (2Fe-2S)-binding protein [Alteromonas sp. a30]